jgi:hypothetical protein
MNIQELQDGLAALGFTSGYAAKDAEGDKPAEIIFWENESKQPTAAAIAKAAPQGAHLREVAEIQQQRQAAYQTEADPIFFESQRDPAVKVETWQAKVEEIKARYPYPAKPE